MRIQSRFRRDYVAKGMKSLNSVSCLKGTLQTKVAATGFLAVVPDFFFGDPANSTDPHFDRDSWLKNHITMSYEDAKPVIAALRSKGVSDIGAAGICWGGKVVVKLAAGSDDIQDAALLHPSRVTKDDINIEVDDIPEGILKLTLENSPGLWITSQQKKDSLKAFWSPPSVDTLKFNVDGSVRGSPDMAGIGGVLRNCNGKVLCLFSLHMGILDSNVVELRAIHKACKICYDARLASNIEIVSDSKTVFS
ncbi:hypothetical protein Ddye_032111 [Dipteronia dyeriana]|uniref:RNase H type-1 domain-containing protein n=1 Tax=Dipteronia dyeriana TaxID=168575 RepID=A0AAD9WMW9_9ROSI|nr:hypothetical protein Ddye_032111 [Dipteronia dyeriana]